MISMTWSNFKGLVMKSVAPAFIDSTAYSIEANPVMTRKRDILSRFADGLDQGDAVHFRHDQVGDDQVEFILGEGFQGLGGAGHRGDRKIVELQKIIQRFPHRVVVIDDEDSFGRGGLAGGSRHRRPAASGFCSSAMGQRGRVAAARLSVRRKMSHAPPSSDAGNCKIKKN